MDKFRLPSDNKSVIFVILIIALIGFGAFSPFFNRSGDKTNSEPQSKEDTTPFVPVSADVVVYGTWSGESAHVKALDLTTGDKHTLAVLPQNVKKVTVLSPTKLLYISETDDRDHGKKLAVYNVSDKKSQVIYEAKDGFGIDDYVVSPNGEMLSTWEVRFAPNSAILQGGSSRVQSLRVNDPASQYRIYDETQSGESSVHYPRAITNAGDIFLDTFVPNTLAGWANGMSVSNFTGTTKEVLSQMQNGTYGTQPVLSPDGRYLAFAGYDGTAGSGSAKAAIKKAISRSNTVELLDTTSRVRTKLSNISTANTYSGVTWDKQTGDILYSQLGRRMANSGLYSYNLATNTSTKIELEKNNDNYTYISTLSGGRKLAGIQDDSSSTLGNLGDMYAPAFMSLATVESKPVKVETNESLMQYITLVPSSYFGSVLASQDMGDSGSPEGTITECDENSLQLCTFQLKPSLAPVRETQQTRLKCEEEIAEPMCREQGYDPETREYRDCVSKIKREYKSKGACYDSPLYLYGNAGDKVKVQVNTLIYTDVPSHNNGYDVTLLNGGNLLIGGKTFESIAYDYKPGIRKITPPTTGTVTSKGDMAKVLTNYAKKLGLNERETRDLVAFGNEKVSAPYVYVSFFDQRTSERILPISFTPEPETYVNIVFYFKQFDTKPLFSPLPPVFPSIPDRTGFTAIEISGIVE